MKKFWMLILAAVFAMNSGVATLWAEEVVPAVTEAVEEVADEALLTEETVLEEEQKPATAVVAEKTGEAVEAVEDEALDDEFSDSMALEDDKAEGALEDITAGTLTADEKVY